MQLNPNLASGTAFYWEEKGRKTAFCCHYSNAQKIARMACARGQSVTISTRLIGQEEVEGLIGCRQWTNTKHVKRRQTRAGLFLFLARGKKGKVALFLVHATCSGGIYIVQEHCLKTFWREADALSLRAATSLSGSLAIFRPLKGKNRNQTEKKRCTKGSTVKAFLASSAADDRTAGWSSTLIGIRIGYP